MPNKRSGFSSSNKGNSHKPDIKMPDSMRNKGQNASKQTPNSNGNNSSNSQAKPQATQNNDQSSNMKSGNSDLNNFGQKSQGNDQSSSPFSDLDKLRNHGPADLGNLGGENDGGSSSDSKSLFDQDEDSNSDKDKSSGNDPDDPNSDLDKDSKDDKNSDSDNPNSDSDQDKQDSDDEQDDSKNPLKKLMDKLKGPLAKKKGKHFKDFLKASKKKHQNESPEQKAKNLLQKLLRLLKRLWQLFKIYTEALRLFLLFKMLMLLQTLANWALGVLNMVITFVISLWTAAVTFFGTIGASILAFLMGGFVLIVAGLIAGALAWFSQWQQQQRARQEYYQTCVVQHGYKNPDDDPANVKGGSGGAWTKKGTKAYKNAKAVFNAFVKHGFSGTAAAAVVGWVQSEGGFDLLDRAEGHYGSSEKENGISAGVRPINDQGGGGGIFQFTPYTKFAPLGSKKWLSADAQIKYVLKSISQGDWNTQYSGGLSIRQFAKSTGSPASVWKGWDGYERGNESAVAQAKPTKQGDMKTAYKLFHGSEYKFNSSKFNKLMKGSKPNGGVTDTNEAADTDSNDGKDPRCGKNSENNDDVGPSSSQIVNTAAKEIKAGKHAGGHKYWSWYGFNSRVEWCAVFVSWVLHHTKGYEYVPKNASVANWASYLKSHHEYHSWKATPKPGWLIMFNWEHTHDPTDHIGIVEKVKNGRVYTLEGNNSDSTKRSSYPLKGADIAAYGSLKKK